MGHCDETELSGEVWIRIQKVAFWGYKFKSMGVLVNKEIENFCSAINGEYVDIMTERQRTMIVR